MEYAIRGKYSEAPQKKQANNRSGLVNRYNTKIDIAYKATHNVSDMSQKLCHDVIKTVYSNFIREGKR